MKNPKEPNGNSYEAVKLVEHIRYRDRLPSSINVKAVNTDFASVQLDILH